MANSYKNIVITPNTGSTTGDPTIVFSGGDTNTNTDITLRVYPTSNGTLSFEGNAGQLFSITNDLSGTLFSVNDVSGIPSIEVDALGNVDLAPFSGNVGIGTTNPVFKLDVIGGANISLPNLTVGGTNVIAAIVAANANAATLSANVNVLAAAVVANDASQGANIATLAAAFVSNSQTLSANVNTLAANVNTLAGAAYAKTGGTISGDVTVTGSLTVSGATTYVNTQTLLIGDNLVTLNADLPGNVQPTENAGLEINRGARTSNAAFIWNENANSWQFTSNTLAGVYSIIASQTDANNVGAAANNFAAATYLTQSAFNSANANSVSQSANVNVLAAAFVSNSQTLSANVNTLAATFASANANSISLSANVNVLAAAVVANDASQGANIATLAAAFVSNSQSLSANVNVLAASMIANTASSRYLGTSNNANLLDGYDYVDFEGYFLNTIDMTALANNTYYPVTIPLATGGQRNGNFVKFKLETRLNSGFVPSWANHPNGFTIQLDWETNASGWGTSGVERKILAYTEGWTTVTICGGIEQMTFDSLEVIYLRGGGRYYLYSSKAVTPTIRTTSFSSSGQTVSPSAVTNNNIWISATGTIALSGAYFNQPTVTIGGTNVSAAIVAANANAATLSANVNVLAAAVVANNASQGANIATLAAAFVANSQTLSANVNTLAAALVLANTSSHADIDALSIVANAKVSSVTGTSGRITSSGGTTPAIDLATAGAGAATYSSGISAVTVDAYGRVTSVTGSAGYLTSSTGLANTSGVSFNGNLFFPTGNVTIGSAALTSYVLDTISDISAYPTSGAGLFYITAANSTSSSNTSIIFRAYDTTSVTRHGAAIQMGKDGAWTGGSGVYPGFMSFWTRESGGTNAEVERMRITAAGNIGIGTTSPGHKLSIGAQTGGTSTATPDTISIGSTYSSAAGTNAKLRLFWDGAITYGFGVSSSQLDYIVSGAYSHVWYSNGSERMRIDGSGLVGIGNTSPGHKLSVNGTAYFTGKITSAVADATDGLDLVSFNAIANMRIIRNNGGGTSDGMYIGYGNAGSATTKIYGGGATTGALEKFSTYTLEPGSFRSPIFYDSDNTAYYFDGAGTSVMNRVAMTNMSPYTDLWHTTSTDNKNRFYFAANARTYFGSPNGYEFRSSTDTDIGVIDNSGIWINNNEVRSPLFRDSNNTAYYVDPAGLTNIDRMQINSANTGVVLSVGDSGLDNGSTYGMVNLTRAADTVRAHLAFIRSGNYVWQTGYLSGTNSLGFFPWNFSGSQGTPALYMTTGSIVYAPTEFRTPIIYDNNNTNYYFDGASTSVMNRIQFDQSNVSAPTTNQAVGSRLTLYPTGGTGHYSIGIEGSHMWFNTPSGYKWYVNETNWATLNADYFQHNSDIRAPIFYDSNDTNSYWDGGTMVLRDASPTIYLRDTDHNSAALHCNSNLFYILRGNNDTTSMTQVNGVWPFYINLTNNDATFGGSIFTSLGSMYAKRFYDNDNTAYFVDPADTSVFNAISMFGALTGRTDTAANTSVANDTGSMSIRGSTTKPATVSFHRAGAYAINMGLDTDNIFRIGGWSDGVNTYRLQLQGPGGTHTFNGTVAATTFSGAGTSLTGTAASLTAGNATTAGGFTPSQTNGVGSRIVVADGSGFINNNYFNSTDDVSTGTVSYIMAKFGDNYYRSATAAKVASFLASQSFASPTFTGTGSVTGGFNVTPGNLGTISTGTTTLAASSGNYQYYTNGGAHTIAAPSSDCAIDVLVTNSATAGAITLSGFTAPTGGGGDTYATTNANRYILSVRRINAISTYVWKALQ